MRVTECNICGETLVAATDGELERRLLSHCEAEHPAAGYDEARAKERRQRQLSVGDRFGVGGRV